MKTNKEQPKHGMIIEKDVEIPMRDGVRLKADIFRPKGGGKFPAIMNLGSYQEALDFHDSIEWVREGPSHPA